jgi:hypothetical protein
MKVQRRSLLAMLAACPVVAVSVPAMAQMLPAPTGLPAGSVAPLGDNVVSYIEVEPGSEAKALSILNALKAESVKEAGSKSFALMSSRRVSNWLPSRPRPTMNGPTARWRLAQSRQPQPAPLPVSPMSTSCPSTAKRESGC